MGEMSADSSLNGNYNVAPYDVFVCDLAEGVYNHPTGTGAQLLTRVINHALNNCHTDIKLSEVEVYAARYNITVPTVDMMASDAAEEDRAALSRHKNAVSRYYKRTFR